MAADGKITIAIEVDGKQVGIASKELDRLENAGHKSGKGVKETEQGLKGVGKESERAFAKVKKFATSLGLVAIGAAAFKTLRASLDDAIKRFDTLNKFPKVLQALGVSAEESEKAMQKLSDGIDGLPTTLDDIASTAQRMYTSFNDIGKATDTALALNNALLGSGSSAQDAQRGAEQYIQALQKGKFEMDEWKTLQETMDIGLIKIAESFGYTGKSAKQDLYNALKDGIITMDQFNDKLIEVGTGTGIMAQLAKENSLGIATSLSNLRNAFARGLADILDSLNRLSKATTGKDIAQNIDSLKVIINQSFKAIGRVIEGTVPIVRGFMAVIMATIQVVKALSPVIAGLMAAYATYTIIARATAIIQAHTAVLKIAMASTKGLTLATQAKMAAQVASTAATNADIVATAAQVGMVKMSTLAIGVLTGAIKLSTAAKIAATAATHALNAAIKLLTGPVGWLTAGVGLLVSGIIAAVKWFKRTSAEAERLNKETEELGESVENLNNQVKENNKSYQDQQREIKASAKANQDLIKRIEELSKKENKSATDKLLLSKYVDQLNKSVAGLNLTYDENSDSLSMSTEKLKAKVNLMKEEESLIAAQERLLEIDKERNEVEMQLEEINKLRDEWNTKLEEGAVKSGEYRDAMIQLEEQEQSLTETLESLSEQQALTEEQIKTSTQNITEAVQQGVALQKLSYDELSEYQQEVVDSMKETWQEYHDAATEMFDTLSDKSELTVQEMTKNMEENQRIISEWADNIAILAERGLDEGLLDKLREAGPESAGHVKALVNASDEELQRLNKVFREGGETATQALVKALGIEETGVMDAVGDLVTQTEQSLRKQVVAADFSGIGELVSDSYGGGIKDGTPEAEKAAKDMADATIKVTKETLESRSPSRVFKEIGKDTTEGMRLGITDGTSSVVNAMKKLLKSSIDQFKNIKSEFKQIGQNAMSGLNQGLNAGKSQVLATARSIANQVTSTMQSALRIQSPSKVMRDKVGKWIPAGIAEGIEDNVSSVYKALNKLSYATPEVALGAHRMAYSGVNVSSISSGNIGGVSMIPQSSENDGGLYEFHFSIPLDGEIIAKKTVRFTARELESMMKQEKRGRGYR